MQIDEFVEKLWMLRGVAAGKAGQPHTALPTPELLRFGHVRGWLEDSDERFPYNPVDRRTAARIVHQFMRIELKIDDLADISAAEKLKDLYTCRSCAAHVAQFYCRGLIECESNFFNHLELLSTFEAVQIFKRLRKLLESTDRPEN